MVRSIHAIGDSELAVEFVTQFGVDLQDDSCSFEVQCFGRTITRWRDEMPAWHQAKCTNGPTEIVNYLIKRVKRVAFGITKNPTDHSWSLTSIHRSGWG